MVVSTNCAIDNIKLTETRCLVGIPWLAYLTTVLKVLSSITAIMKICLNSVMHGYGIQ